MRRWQCKFFGLGIICIGLAVVSIFKDSFVWAVCAEAASFFCLCIVYLHSYSTKWFDKFDTAASDCWLCVKNRFPCPTSTGR